ncbi:MAG: GGDEF domain-containing protein, partial [Anaerolineales bacterium]|nr:GGDEF domain-containing protein [Anaerolineales bacterium]
FLVVDIDNFQAVNALYGLAAGDSLLRSAAQILQQTLRKADILGRLGGDEFGALLLETTPETSIQAAHRLRARFDDLRLDGQTQALSVTVSIALVDVTEAVTIEHLLQKAEDLLKQAKAAGGNQIIKK